jgi:hypothetical protein
VFLTNLIELNHTRIAFASLILIKFVHIIPLTVNNMRDKIKELESEVAKIEDGKADISTLNHAIYLTGLVLEQLHIVRYKAYTEPQEGSNPEPMAFDFSEQENPETPELPIEEAPAQVLVEDLFEGPVLQDVSENSPVKLAPEEPEGKQQEELSAAQNAESQGAKVAEERHPLQDLIAQCRGKHEKIDSFNGHYSLREKIDFINELFGGSSETFSNAVRLIDHHSDVASMLPHLKEYFSTHEWEKAKKEVLLGFLEKLVACYEDH